MPVSPSGVTGQRVAMLYTELQWKSIGQWFSSGLSQNLRVPKAIASGSAGGQKNIKKAEIDAVLTGG